LGSVFGHGRIDFIRPCEDAALEIENFAEPGFAQEINGFRGALSAAAMRDDFPRRVQFVNAARQFTERDQVALQIANLKFVRLAHVQDEQIVSAIEA
jgi:hypothetical protein